MKHMLSLILLSFSMMISSCGERGSYSTAPSLDNFKKDDKWAELSDFQIQQGMKIHSRIYVDPGVMRFNRPEEEALQSHLVSRLRFATKGKDVTYVVENQGEGFDDNSDDILVTINHHMKANGKPYKLIYTVRQNKMYWQRTIERSIDEPYEIGIVYQPDQDNRPEKRKFLGGIYSHADRFFRDLNQKLQKDKGD